VLAERLPLFLAVLAILGGGESCSSCVDQPASPVTFRVTNQLPWPIFVRDDAAQLGLTVQKDSDGAWVDLAEFAECSCLECDSVCSLDCQCAPTAVWVRKIAAGATAERQWNGEYRSDDHATCLLGRKDCLGDRVAAQPGSHRVKLCWASSLSGTLSDSGDRFKATLPEDLSCATTDFELPAEGVVEVVTSAPPGCRVASECAFGQLCLSGHCSSTCLPNDVPVLGGEWTLEIGDPDNAGFFEVSEEADGAKVYRGSGTVSTVRYSSGTTNLTVLRTVGGIEYTASFYYTLPGKRVLPLAVGESIDVVLVDRSSGSRRLARALAIRQQGKLLLAADTGRQGRVLDALQREPFDVETDGEPFACNPSDCGRRLHRRVTFVAPEQSIPTEPGKAAVVKVGDDTYEAVSVANYSDEVEGCGASPMVPYLILLQREQAP
jgi:hypothetical protein